MRTIRSGGRGMRALLAAVLAGSAASPALGWGLLAHRMVADSSVARLPAPLSGWFEARRERLADLSVEPDTVRRGLDPDEAPRHFIDLDTLVEDPADVSSLPRTFEQARALFGKRLVKEGILPWWIAESEKNLAEAMRGADGGRVLMEAAYLSHYVADLHQPLHLTSNFDGQQTCSEGVHTAYERFLIEASPAAYRSPAGAPEPVRAVASVADWAIRAAARNYSEAARILAADRAATLAMKKEGGDFYTEFRERAGPGARRLLEEASRATASLWISAWIKAGRPEPAAWKTPPAPAGAEGVRMKPKTR